MTSSPASGTSESAESTCALQASAAVSSPTSSASPTQRIGMSPARIAAAVFAATTSSVSPNIRRRSACPTSTYRHPSSARTAAETSPVNAPESCSETSCAPTARSPAASRQPGIDGYCGMTNISTRSRAGCCASSAATSVVHVIVRACEKYIFRLAPISLRSAMIASSDALVGADLADLLGGCALRVERVGEPLGGQAPGELDTDHPLPHAQHLGIVGEHRALHTVGVVSGDGADAGDLVRR